MRLATSVNQTRHERSEPAWGTAGYVADNVARIQSLSFTVDRYKPWTSEPIEAIRNRQKQLGSTVPCVRNRCF